jgi:AcrR family transcriptional regulator
VLLKDGYYGLTMGRIADESRCPKGTTYQHFSCKEDVVLALALQSHQRRFQMMSRGAAFQGKSRERLAGVGEGVGLFTRLHREDAEIIHVASGSIREKAARQRVEAVLRLEREVVDLVRGILLDAVSREELALEGFVTVERMTFAFWSLIDGGVTLSLEGVPEHVLGSKNALHDLWLAYNVLADGYGWRPLFREWDWEETFAQVRRSVFPKEAQELYGEGAWYGDAGKVHPRYTHYWPETS